MHLSDSFWKVVRAMFAFCRYVVGKCSQVVQLFQKHSRPTLVLCWMCVGAM